MQRRSSLLSYSYRPIRVTIVSIGEKVSIIQREINSSLVHMGKVLAGSGVGHGAAESLRVLVDATCKNIGELKNGFPPEIERKITHE
jgi:hypothetical protein